MKLKFTFLTILLIPALLFGQPKTKMYGDGNTSIKINDSANYLSNADRRIWLENSALAFNANEDELYFRHPTDKYFQVWSVARKQKLSEITFSEAGNTAKGRMIIAAFPNTIYREDEYANSKIWLSPDLYVTFDTRSNFTVSDGQNQAEKSFTLKLRKSIEDNFSTYYRDYFKKANLKNTRYQLYYHKKSNKVFIITYADQVYKKKKDVFSNPYNGVFSYDLATSSLMVLAENPDCCGGHNLFKDKWFFLNDHLIRRYVKKENSYYSRFSLSTLSQQDLADATKDKDHYNKEPDGWKNLLAGIDLQENLYFIDPTNNHIEIYYFDKSNTSKGTLATILHSSGKLNEVYYETNNDQVQQEYAHREIKNVVAISPSGKYIAYLCINNRTTVGNYASVMMYNTDEKDKVYTLNDQTKYQPYIATGYRTNKDSEELELAWQKISDERNKEKEEIAIAKKKQEEAAKLERKKRYTPQIEELKAKFLELKKERDATLKEDINLYKLGDFKAVLVRHNWSAREIYKPYSTSPSSHYFYAKEEVAFRYSSNGVYAVIKEVLTFPVSKKTDKSLLLTGDPGFYEGYVDGITKGVQYITSNFDDIPLVDWKGNECSTNTDAAALSQVKGQEILEQGNLFKNFSALYRASLLKAKFKLTLLANNTFILTANTASNVNFIFEFPETVQQIELDKKMIDLRKEIKKLEDFVENGN